MTLNGIIVLSWTVIVLCNSSARFTSAKGGYIIFTHSISFCLSLLKMTLNLCMDFDEFLEGGI